MRDRRCIPRFFTIEFFIQKGLFKMDIVPLYLKSKIRLSGMLLLFVMIFVLVFVLYGLPAEAVLYASLLCTVPGLALTVYDFLRFREKYRLLRQLQSNITVTSESLPTAGSPIEEMYLSLIRILCGENSRLTRETERKKAEMIDYYTLWVHQIKTPIAAMRLILKDSASERDKELLYQLFQTERYVEMVLAYLRMGSDTTDYVLREYELGDIVRQAIRKYAPMFIRRKISLELRPLQMTVLTDEKWLCFAIEQILSNAVKYTEAGRISIYCEPGNALVIQDTGIGIAPEDLPRVCEKGFTGYNGRTDKKASGIGLYLTKKILKRLGCSIGISSAVGIGTKVTLTLPTDENSRALSTPHTF